MEENLEKPNENEYLDSDGYFKKGNPGGGRPKDTEETKLIKKATKQLIAEYKEALAEALPLIKPVLVAKALDGDLGSIKEVNDRVMGRAKETMEVQGGLKIEFASDFNKNAPTTQ